MITRTYIDKTATIIKDSELNTGLNPVAELSYGTSVTRILCHFDHSKIKEMVNDGTFPNIDKLKHILRITNVGSIDFAQMKCNEISSITDDIKIRATSFDLIFFLIPQDWDSGSGFDYQMNYFNQGLYRTNGVNPQDTKKLVSVDGANWFQAKNGYKWKEEGVYSNSTLSVEYDNFSSELGSNIIIGRQHFNVGNEDIALDITEIFNKFITGELDNYGLGIAYTPMTELIQDKEPIEHYTGFFTNKTNTFFEPFVETTYDDVISDDRPNFTLDKDNKLYLYCNIGGYLANLDELPTCDVNGTPYEVHQFSKGIYYINIKLSRNDFKPYTMLYDTWSNIKYNGTEFDAVEMDFTVHPNTSFFNFSNKIEQNEKVTPFAYGIKHSEKIKRGDIRKVNILAKTQYSRNKAQLVDKMYARVYIKDGEREVEVFPYEQINKTFDENYFLIDTTVLIPQRYYIDVKVEYNRELIVSKEILQFDIVNEINH